MDPDDTLPNEPVKVTNILDLHGFFPEQIPEIMDAFIENACELELKEIKVIHGKGKSRLKYEVYKFLSSHPKILEYCDAPPVQGGWGATIIILKQQF